MKSAQQTTLLTSDDANVRDRCVRFEGVVPYMYKDSQGNVTVGIGTLLATARAAQRFRFVHRDNPRIEATQAEIAAEWAHVNATAKFGSWPSTGDTLR